MIGPAVTHDTSLTNQSPSLDFCMTKQVRGILLSGTSKLVHEESRPLGDMSLLCGGSPCAVGKNETNV